MILQNDFKLSILAKTRNSIEFQDGNLDMILTSLINQNNCPISKQNHNFFVTLVTLILIFDWFSFGEFGPHIHPYPLR